MSNGDKGSMFDVYSELLQSDIPFSKEDKLFKGGATKFRQGVKPQGEFKQGEHPQDENGPFPLMSKGVS